MNNPEDELCVIILTMNSQAYAAKILYEVIIKHKSLNIALAQEKIPSEQHGLTQEICYGVLRWYPRLDLLSKALLHKPLKSKAEIIQVLILIGLYQVLFLKLPPASAVDATTEAAKLLKQNWATGLVNAVLRNFLRDETKYLAAIDKHTTGKYAHPAWLIKMVQQAWPAQWQKILEANNQRPPMFLRVNLSKISRENYLAELKTANIAATAAAFTHSGILLDQPMAVHKLPRFTKGFASVQDNAAQLTAELLELAPGQTILDACAAPGGKTCHILESEAKLKNLVAVDNDAQRVIKIQENLQRLNLKASLVTGDASEPEQWWDGKLFDRILLDAPCSATGVIRRHVDIKLLRRSNDIPILAEQQLNILSTLWPLLKPDGILLYITCSVLPQENNEVIAQFLAQHSDAKEIQITADWGVTLNPGRQILPGQENMDGFYFAKLQKLL